eukprot:1476761-Heterocapsa_arctica.AAC.1
MALAQGRLIPHGTHADLHKRAIQTMEGRISRNIRVKWVPSHKDEQGVKDGIITQEGMEGNREADKLAPQGVGMHEVPLHHVEK